MKSVFWCFIYVKAVVKTHVMCTDMFLSSNNLQDLSELKPLALCTQDITLDTVIMFMSFDLFSSAHWFTT